MMERLLRKMVDVQAKQVERDQRALRLSQDKRLNLVHGVPKILAEDPERIVVEFDDFEEEVGKIKPTSWNE